MQNSTAFYDISAPRKPTNISINADLLRQSREAGLNISRIAGYALEQALREKRRQDWENENREAIDALHGFYAEHGSFADKMRAYLNETV